MSTPSCRCSPGESDGAPLVCPGGSPLPTCPVLDAGVHEDTTVRRATYWHGGAPGLKVGTHLLPPAITRTSITLGSYMDEAEKTRSGYRRDRVYVTTQREAGELYAALYPEGGSLYRVVPHGELEEDPDCTEPGLSFACLGARIVEVVPLHPVTVFAILSAVMSGGAR